MSAPTNKQKPASDAVKKSLVVSGLVGTTGFFIAKAMGLVYTVPFSYILDSDAYMNYYGSAYRIYSYILNVFSAGFPFAIATLVAKYGTLKNYKTVLQVKRLSILFMALIGFLGMIFMMVLSAFIAPIMADGADGIRIMTIVLCILSVAIFLVPILSAYRGFIQGCKEMEEYAFSQAFEQLFRVGFLLSAACLCVYVFNMERVWALYSAVASTSVAALAGLIQIMRFSKKTSAAIEEDAKAQTEKAIPIEPLFKEFFWLAVPYMISALLGYSDDIFNTILLPIGLKNSSYSADQINVVMSAVNYAGSKLNAIPMILAPGFTAAIIPHISASLVEKDYTSIRKNILECINIVLFIGMLLSFLIMVYATSLFYVLFYTSDLNLAGNATRWIAIEGFLGTITPVISSLMMALRRQKSLLRRLTIATVVKGILLIPFTSLWGIAGTVMATVISYGYLIIFNCLELSIRYKVNFHSTLVLIVKTLIGLAALGFCAWGLYSLGLGAVTGGKIVCLLTLCVNGLISVIVFAVVELLLGVPQELFHFRLRRKAKQ